MINFKDIFFMNCYGVEDEFNSLRYLHRIVMTKSVEETIGHWNEDFQFNRLRKHFNESHKTLKFIMYNEDVIGTINIRDKFFEDANENYSYVEQFYIYPKHQRSGIGSWLITEHVPLKSRLSFLKNDEKALRFYEKNRFLKYKEDQYQIYMERKK